MKINYLAPWLNRLVALATLSLGFSLDSLSAKDIKIIANGKEAVVDQADYAAFVAAQKAKKARKTAAASTPVAGRTTHPETLAIDQFVAGRRAQFLEKISGAGQNAERLPATPDELEKVELVAVNEGFRLRGAWDPVKLFHYNDEYGLWMESPTTGDASDGAEFGWNRNRLTKTDSWNAKGVAYWPIVFNADAHRHFLLLPSIEFNRDSTTDGTPDELNSLIGRIGLDWNQVNMSKDPKAHDAAGYVVRASIGYQTDFDFKSGQWLFDLQSEPVDEKQGVGVFSPKSEMGDGDADHFLRIPQTRRKFTLAPIFSLADISSLGDKASLAELEKQYATVGFKVGLDYEMEFLSGITFLARTKIGAEYRWWTTLGAKSATYDYLDAHILLPFFGSDDKLVLKAFYRRGDTPVTLEKVDTLGLSLTAKF